MATSTIIPVDVYLRTHYRPDCDYVDGEVVERNVGEHDHASLQLRIGAYLLTIYGPKGFDVVVEQRVQVSAMRCHVPDICLTRAEIPMEQIFRKPPLVVIEILSPDDRFSSMQVRINDYLAFGVPNIWLIDRKERRAFVCTPHGNPESDDLSLTSADGEIVLPLPGIFETLPQ